MGFNTAIIVRNDFLHEIKDDPEFGQKVYGAVIGNRRGAYHGQGFDVLPSQHANYTQIIAIGGNCIWRFGSKPETDEKELRYLADAMGFRLVRKAMK